MYITQYLFSLAIYTIEETEQRVKRLTQSCMIVQPRFVKRAKGCYGWPRACSCDQVYPVCCILLCDFIQVNPVFDPEFSDSDPVPVKKYEETRDAVSVRFRPRPSTGSAAAVSSCGRRYVRNAQGKPAARGCNCTGCQWGRNSSRPHGSACGSSQFAGGKCRSMYAILEKTGTPNPSRQSGDQASFCQLGPNHPL